MTTQTLGIDIGGANLKAAHSDGAARTVPFALWKHPERLADELKTLTERMPRFDRVAVTMTGELCDCFADRLSGVRAILQAVERTFDEPRLRVWSSHGRLLNFETAMNDPASIASANWLAQAHFIARRYAMECVLLIDTGSTTTDIVYLENGTPRVRGLTDAVRLVSGELVYTGVRRTPICAVLGMEVASELFATMLDAYLLSGMLDDNETDCDTADGRPATRAFAHARMARLRCTDAHLFGDAEAKALAQRAIQVQSDAVESGAQRVLADRRKPDRVIVSGSGEFVGRNVATRDACLRKVPITSLAEVIGPALSEAACAYAIAILASEE